MNCGPGSVINLTNFTHYTPSMQVGFKPPKGMVAVFMLLGNADKKDPNSFDPEAAIRALGWVPATDSADLLSALEGMVAVAEKNIYPQPDKDGTPWAKLEAARAAIAKAKGGAA